MRNETHITQAVDEALSVAALPLKPRGITAPVRGLAPQPRSLSRRPSSKDVWRALLTLVPKDEMSEGRASSES